MHLDGEEISLAREIVWRGEQLRSYSRAVERGRLVRPHRGSYVDADRWRELSDAQRYTFSVLAAVVASRSSPIVSHVSAAALHGAPLIGPRPTLIHVLATSAAGTRTEHGFRKHATDHLLTDLERRGELRLTNLVRTLADIAVDAPFLTAIGILDWGMREHGVAPAELRDKLDRLDIRRGRSRAVRAIEFADSRAASPGESLSRVRLLELGFPAPVLQQEFRDRRGLIGFADFWWPAHGLIGEFDGIAKYVREEYTDGRSTAEVVIDEKLREDRLRALGHRLVRWGWRDAREPYGLNPVLLPLLPRAVSRKRANPAPPGDRGRPS
ncbi:MAG: hypothetical protein AB7K08_09750 [Microbacteriaceae bacterium]